MPSFADSVILPHRVVDARTRTVVDFEGLLYRCSFARVVTVGENHEDPATHKIELAILEGLFRHRGSVILSLEMFERDVQPVIDLYLAGEIGEDDFLNGSRPWGNYPDGYRPMVEFSKENSLPVVASNIPRRIAAIVASSGFDSAVIPDEELAYMPEIFIAPQDDYYRLFADTMQMPGMEHMGVTEEKILMFYEAQVLKDETMAESISRAALNDPDSLVYHVTGSFHTIDNLGTLSRVKRNLPGVDIVSILIIPVDDILDVIPEDITKADYWIFVQAPPHENDDEENSE